MKPHVAIRKVRLRHYDYSVRMGTGKVRYERHGLRSIAECLHDAATALGPAFHHIEVSCEGMVLGCYSQPTLEHDPVLLARRLESLLAARGKAPVTGRR